MDLMQHASKWRWREPAFALAIDRCRCRFVRRSHTVCALAAVCVLTGLPGTSAWAPAGHERIARVAQGVLDEKHRYKVKRMLHSELLDFAGWEHAMTGKHPETDTLHWHRQDPEWTCAAATDPKSSLHQIGDQGGHIRCDGHGAEAGSLFCSLAYFFDHFAHDTLLAEYPEPQEPIDTPKALPSLEKITALELTPAHYLRWLAILVGDLHQPLHWLKKNDYGREIKVSWRGKGHTLLDFWEEFIPKNLPPMSVDKVLKKQYDERKGDWEHKIPPELFRVWAKEAAQALCSDVYSAIDANRTDGGADSAFIVTEELYLRWLKLAHDLTTLGGQRLAFVLHDIIEHKRHKNLHKDGRGRHHHKKNWKMNLATNAGCAVLVVPLILLFVRWHGNAGGFSKMFSSGSGKSFLD